MKKLLTRNFSCTSICLLLCAFLAMNPHVAAQEGTPDVQFDESTFPDMQIDMGEEFGEDFGFEMGEDMDAFNDPNFNAEGLDPEEAAAMTAAAAAMTIAMIAFAALGVIMLLVVAFLLSSALGVVPEQFREIPSWLPWLLLVPLINIVILIVAFIKVPKSLQRYLESKGDTSMGDCGASNGLWGSILYLLGCTFPIGLVLLVMAILKINQAKKLAQAA